MWFFDDSWRGHVNSWQHAPIWHACDSGPDPQGVIIVNIWLATYRLSMLQYRHWLHFLPKPGGTLVSMQACEWSFSCRQFVWTIQINDHDIKIFIRSQLALQLQLMFNESPIAWTLSPHCEFEFQALIFAVALILLCKNYQIKKNNAYIWPIGATRLEALRAELVQYN